MIPVSLTLNRRRRRRRAWTRAGIGASSSFFSFLKSHPLLCLPSKPTRSTTETSSFLALYIKTRAAKKGKRKQVKDMMVSRTSEPYDDDQMKITRWKKMETRCTKRHKQARLPFRTLRLPSQRTPTNQNEHAHQRNACPSFGFALLIMMMNSRAKVRDSGTLLLLLSLSVDRLLLESSNPSPLC
ncbi:hypothetical protein B0T20DRAFT_249014 [Sordaria brevicollis]|uniref:Uncharacterized protein n=1 Tax=Sordaria brevicollis TaxID=83679 RepID=A0AAE0UB50_SORBR|nr:hypothetical protein B0T20DRAFT_249014 [Sordaria brevicollis]